MPSAPTIGASPPDQLAGKVRAGDRAALARAITLVESLKEADREYAYELLRLLMPETGDSHRLAVSGPPGVGKSTLIDACGMRLIEAGHRVAVLAIDPSSTLSGGSILGDKSRMSRLAQDDDAFIRPSPTDLSLGGVSRRTREAMFLCEAAGFDRVLIETVGVGQSEIQVAGMVDTFMVLVQPGAGDELQGIKKGIIELADILAVTKADGDNIALARAAVAEYSSALRYSHTQSRNRQSENTESQTTESPSTESPSTESRVIAVSALTGDGLDQMLHDAAEHRRDELASGRLQAKRQADATRWLEELAEQRILRRWRAQSAERKHLPDLADAVLDGRIRADQGAAESAPDDS